MKTRKLITAAVITLGMSASAQAAPKGLDTLLARLLSQAVAITTEELKNDVSESVLNTAYHFDSQSPRAIVEIREINVADGNGESE